MVENAKIEKWAGKFNLELFASQNPHNIYNLYFLIKCNF